MRKHEIRRKHKNLHQIVGGGSQCFPPIADDAFRLKSIPLEVKTFLFLLNSLSLTFIFRKLTSLPSASSTSPLNCPLGLWLETKANFLSGRGVGIWKIYKFMNKFCRLQTELPPTTKDFSKVFNRLFYNTSNFQENIYTIPY